MPISTQNTQKIDDCFELYKLHGGRRHDLIEKEMRSKGYRRFCRRIMYTRRERGRVTSGWIDRFGWRREIDAETRVGRRLAKIRVNRQKARRLRKKSLQSPRLPELQSFQHAHFPNSETLQHCNSANSLPADFQDWLKLVSPGMTWDWRHQIYIYDHLKRVTEGTCKRLMIFLPPRHGKSELVTVRYAAWRLRRDPSMKVILAGYNQSLANNFSRKIKNVLCDDAAVSAATCPGVNAGTLARIDAKALRRPAEIPDDLFNDGALAGGTGDAGRGARVPTNPASPFPFTRTRLKNSEAEWETTMGGGLRAVGVGGGVTGFGAQMIVIDDPVKSRAEAESPKIREKVWNWYTDDLYTRLEPNGSIVLIQTRWHEDDLAGRLIKEMENGGDQWEIVNLPALAEEGEKMSGGEEEMRRTGVEETDAINKIKMSLKGTKLIAQGKDEVRHPGNIHHEDSDPEGVEQTATDVAPLQGAEVFGSDPGVTLPSSAHPRLLSLSPSATGDPLDRQPGEALCPERYDETALENLKRQLGSYSFAALYQQHPVPADGGIFKRHWFSNIVREAPPGLKWCRGYDLAVSTRTTADHTASFRVAYDEDGDLYIDGGFRKRIEFPEQKRYIIDRIKNEPDTEHGIELALHGQAMMQDLRRTARLQGRRFRGVAVREDKVSRALLWAPLAEEGRVKLVKGAWNEEFIEEACTFPSGASDDQIDAVSIAVQMFEKRGGTLMRI